MNVDFIIISLYSVLQVLNLRAKKVMSVLLTIIMQLNYQRYKQLNTLFVLKTTLSQTSSGTHFPLSVLKGMTLLKVDIQFHGI